MFISIREAMDRKNDGKTISIRGWVYRHRSSAKVVFIVLRDTSGIIQCTVKPDNEKFAEADKLPMESSVELTGTLRVDPRAPGGYELGVEKMNVVGRAERFPIVKDQSTEFLMDVRHLALRTRHLTNILKIRSTMLFAFHEYLRSQRYVEVEAPSFSGATSEGGSEVFEVKYYKGKAYLTQSWQFYAENIINAIERAYAIAPSFRAEKSHTFRHLTEYWHLEVEAAWANMDDIARIAEGCITHAAENILRDNQYELAELKIDPARLQKVKSPFPRMTYDEAMKVFEKKGHDFKYGSDLGSEDERILTEGMDVPLILTNYPSEIMAFYKKEDPKNSARSLNFNILAPRVGEITDGSAREDDLEKIKAKLKASGKDLAACDWYLDGRRYGSVPHAGFGLGVERTLQWLLDLEHIRDTIAFPRFMNRITP